MYLIFPANVQKPPINANQCHIIHTTPFCLFAFCGFFFVVMALIHKNFMTQEKWEM